METHFPTSVDKNREKPEAPASGNRHPVDVSTGHAAREALSDAVDQVRVNAVPVLRELADDAQDAVRSSADAAQGRALRWRDDCVAQVRGHPLQSVLIAAGVGAVLALVTSMLTRHDSATR